MNEKKTSQARASTAEDRATIAPPEQDELPKNPEELQAAIAAQLPKGSPDYKNEDLTARLRARHMPQGQNALKSGEIIKRRKHSFDIDGVECEPDMFVNDNGEYITFRVTLRSLSSAQEIESLRGIKDGSMAPFAMAKYSLYAINNKVLSEDERDFYWECLGTGGRQICMNAFGTMGAASESAMGKYLSSRSED